MAKSTQALERKFLSINVYKLIWFLGVEMKITDELTLLTNKIVAMTDRKTAVARDLYDVYYLWKVGFSIDEKLILERTGFRQ